MSSLPGGASMTIRVSVFGAQPAGSTSPREIRKYRRKLASADATLMLPTRHPRSRVSQVRMRVSRGSCWSIRISIVRDTVPVTSIRAAFAGLGLLLLALDPARADDTPCPPPAPVAAANPSESAATNPEGTKPEDAPITIEADDQDFEFDINGNARLCGNVHMRQGDRLIRADC